MNKTGLTIEDVVETSLKKLALDIESMNYNLGSRPGLLLQTSRYLSRCWVATNPYTGRKFLPHRASN